MAKDPFHPMDLHFMRLALRLARRGYGRASPNPMVGALLVKHGRIIGRGWHHQAGKPHAEIEAIRDAQQRRIPLRGATLFVTLEPCSTTGRTPPCTDAIIQARIQRVVVAATDPNPAHAGRAYDLLRQSGIEVLHGVLTEQSHRLNESFNHWIVHRTPFVTIKAAMTLDGRIATASGDSQWISGELARDHVMELRQGADAILVGINTVLADDPRLTVRLRTKRGQYGDALGPRRIVLDAKARTPLTARIVADDHAQFTTIVAGPEAPPRRVKALSQRVTVWTAPALQGRIDLEWLLKRLGTGYVTHLLVEGGGEVNASFLLGGFAHRVAFFYAAKILGNRAARPAVAGRGLVRLQDLISLRQLTWRRFGSDLFLTARVDPRTRSFEG